MYFQLIPNFASAENVKNKIRILLISTKKDTVKLIISKETLSII